MKIFNWVHKAFHHSPAKDHGLASNTKNNKTEANVIIGDSQALLKKVAFGDVLGDWNDGILAIGTLGYCDPLKPFNFQNDYLSLKNHEDEMDNEEQDDDEDQSSNCYYNAEDEELSPLMHTKFENNYEDDDHDHVNEKISVDDDDDDDDEVLVTPLTSPLVSYDYDEITESSRVERITLADLFLADSDDKTISMKQKDLTAKLVLEKPCLKCKNGFPTFSKKPIPPNCVVDKKDKPHPIKQIQKLMKKMIKKKIHPAEFDVEDQKPEMEKIGASIQGFLHHSLSLLPI